MLPNLGPWVNLFTVTLLEFLYSIATPFTGGQGLGAEAKTEDFNNVLKDPWGQEHVLEAFTSLLVVGGVLCYRNMFPENLVQACFQSSQTYYVPKKPINETDNATLLTTTLAPMTTTLSGSNLTLAKPVEEFERKLRYIDGMNVLGQFTVLLV